MEYKTCGAEFKAIGGDGRYQGYFSIFGNVDDGGDVIPTGAFTKTLQERAQPGRSRIKVFMGHDWSKLIGPPPDKLIEDSKGLYAEGRLTLKSFWGNEAYQLMADGALTEGSIGYESIPNATTYRNDGARVLREVRLYEISPVPLGMNPLTEVQAVKMWRAADANSLRALLGMARQFKLGARHSGSDQALVQQLHDVAMELGATCGAGKQARRKALALNDRLTMINQAIATVLSADQDWDATVTAIYEDGYAIVWDPDDGGYFKVPYAEQSDGTISVPSSETWQRAEPRWDIAGFAAGPAYAVGQAVQALVDHMPGMTGRIGTITEANNGPYYAVDFGDGQPPHKWLTEAEVAPVPTAQPGMGQMQARLRAAEKALALRHKLRTGA